MGTLTTCSLYSWQCVSVFSSPLVLRPPKPKPRCWYPPCHYGESGFPTRYSPYYNRASGGDYNNYYYNRASGGDYNNYYYNRGSSCSGGRSYCCKGVGVGGYCGCYCQ